MLSIADLKIAVIGSDYVPSALDLDKSDEKKLIFSKLDCTLLKFNFIKNISNT